MPYPWACPTFGSLKSLKANLSVHKLIPSINSGLVYSLTNVVHPGLDLSSPSNFQQQPIPEATELSVPPETIYELQFTVRNIHRYDDKQILTAEFYRLGKKPIHCNKVLLVLKND